MASLSGLARKFAHVLAGRLRSLLRERERELGADGDDCVSSGAGVCGSARDTLASGPEAAVALGHGACGMRRLDGTDGLAPLREPFVTAQPPKRSALRVIPRNETRPERSPPRASLRGFAPVDLSGDAPVTRGHARVTWPIRPRICCGLLSGVLRADRSRAPDRVPPSARARSRAGGGAVTQGPRLQRCRA